MEIECKGRQDLKQNARVRMLPLEKWIERTPEVEDQFNL